jgi:hypothetical protein
MTQNGEKITRRRPCENARFIAALMIQWPARRQRKQAQRRLHLKGLLTPSYSRAAHSYRFTGAIKRRVDKLAPVYVVPGEDETLALMSGALRVLRSWEAVAKSD